MIRKAKKEDATRIVYINITSWKETYKNIFPDTFLANLNPYDEINIEKCQNNISEYIVYEKDNQILGFARYGKNKKEYDDSYAEIYALYVDNNYHGQKIGTKLVNHIIKKISHKYKYLLISTLKNNTANKFYEKIGGEKIGTTDFILENKKYTENLYRFTCEKRYK